MSKSVLIINGHPDPAAGHFCAAIAKAYEQGAHTGGHVVHRLDIGALTFPILRSPKDWAETPPPPDIVKAQESVRRADHLVFIYPMWMGTMPALTKGFLEQLFRPGFSHEDAPHGFPKPLLKGKSVRIIVTMGMPAFIYSLWFRAHALKNLERNIFRFAGLAPVRHSLIGMMGALSDARREAILKKVSAHGRRAR